MNRTAILAVLLLAACGRQAEAPSAGEAAAVQEQASEQPAGEVAEQAPAKGQAAAPAAPAAESPCLIQGGQPVPENRIRAVGTEPFWAASVEGRCVTYMTPENQSGVRIWTRFEGASENGRWTGALDGKPFVMATRSEPRCSDGMSDEVYPLAVTLEVRGERRTGCAKPR